MKSKTYKPFALVTLGLSLSPYIHAADYAAGINMKVYGSHDDNIRMTEDKAEINGVVASPGLTLSAESETAKLGLDSRFDFYRYDDSGYDTDNQWVELSSSKAFERSLIGLGAQIVRDSTTTSELLDSGRIGTTAQRSEEYSANAFWQWSISENNQLTANSRYAIRDYRGPGYIGYNYWDNSLGWSYKLGERWSLDVVGQYSQYRSETTTVNVPAVFIAAYYYPPIGGTIDNIQPGDAGEMGYSSENTTFGGQVGASYHVNEQNSVRLLIGRSRNKTTYPIEDPTDICADIYLHGLAPLCTLEPEDNIPNTATLNWTWAGEVQQLTVNATKSQQPSSNGIVIDATRLSAEWSYRITERDRIALSLSGTRNRALTENGVQRLATASNRDYASATAEYHRQLSESWYIDASYQYRHSEYKDFDSEADANAITLGISYRPVARHWSR